MRSNRSANPASRGLMAAAGLLLLATTAFAPPLAAQGRRGAPPNDSLVRANYTKREVQIPMRDGVKLFTSIYMP